MGLAVTKQEAFWEACGYGRLHEVKHFLEQPDIDVNWKSYTHNCCPIHVASQGKVEIVKLLLEAKCDVNARDDRDNLAIHHAAMKGHADILQMLLDAGSLIDAQDKNGWTSLINAAYWCQPETCRVLVTNKCNVHLKNKDERNALHEACRSQSEDEKGLAEIVELLVECGCDLNSKSSDIGEADFSPLMFCGYHGHTMVAKVLIDADCDINAQGSNGWSALHWAADRNKLETVEVLLNGGINPLLKGRRGELAIDRATDLAVREALAEAMNVTCSEYQTLVDRRGINRNKLYIQSANGADNNTPELATSPITSSYIQTSAVFQSLQQQMNSLSTQSKTKKTKRTERKIASRIFEPPKPPVEPTVVTPVLVGMRDCEFEFMDDHEDDVAASAEEPATSKPQHPVTTNTTSGSNTTDTRRDLPSSGCNNSQSNSSQSKSKVENNSSQDFVNNTTNADTAAATTVENSIELVENSIELNGNVVVNGSDSSIGLNVPVLHEEISVNA